MEHGEIHYLLNSQPPLFIYTVTPQQVSTSTGTNNPVSLSISVLNPKQNGFVDVAEIMFGISIGDGQTDLTDDTADVTQQSEQSDWLIEKQKYKSSPLIFKVTPSPPTTGLQPGESINFQLMGVNVNDTEGGASFFIAETVEGSTNQETKTINKVSPSLSIEYFRADSSNIGPGGQATLSWVTGGASYCTIEGLENSICQGSPQPPEKLPTTGSLQVCPAETTLYTLTAHDSGGGHVEAQAGVSVTSAQILSFTANPTNIDIFNAPSTLEWDVLNDVSLQLDPGAIDVTGQTSHQVTPTVTTNYTLTAHGAAGLPVSNEATIYVEPPAITSFTFEPQDFVRGQPVALAWVTEHAKLSIDQGIGVVKPPSGNVVVSLQEQTAYTLTAEGLGPTVTAHVTATPEAEGWNQQPAPSFSAFSTALTTFQGKLWLFNANGDEDPDPKVMHSVDGQTWTPITVKTLPAFINNPISVVAFKDKLWFIGNYNEGGPSVWSSEDGANWTPHSPTAAGLFPRAGAGGVLFNNQLVLMGGFISGGPSIAIYNDVWVSDDGVTWTQRVAHAPWSPRSYFGLALFNNELWMCGGIDGDGQMLAEAWHSPDGVRWSQWNKGAVVPWAGRDFLCLQAANDKLYLIGGHGAGASASSDMWVMDAGMNWSLVSPMSQFTDWGGGAVTLFNWRIWLTPSDSDTWQDLSLWTYNP
jgi:hypothetical protein